MKKLIDKAIEEEKNKPFSSSKLEIIIGYCPKDYGYNNCHVTNDNCDINTDCYTCWNKEV